jgi:hypothetical protein
MIIVVLVSFVIITGGFMFIRSAAEYGHHDLKRDIIEELKTE